MDDFLKKQFKKQYNLNYLSTGAVGHRGYLIKRIRKHSLRTMKGYIQVWIVIKDQKTITEIGESRSAVEAAKKLDVYLDD